MVKTYALAALLLASTVFSPAFALSPDDTMMDWSHASDRDRASMLDGLGPSLSPAYQTEKTELLACLDRVGHETPHAALAIRDIVRACVAIVEHRDPDGAPKADEIKA